MSQNKEFIYLNEDLDKSIFRIFSQQYFCDLAISKKNTLVHPSKWEDPFENYLLKHKIETEYGPASNRSRKNIYGQCWTLKEESDAMWRIYSANCRGIKVKTTIRKLFKSFKESCSEISNQYCYLGKVRYYKEENFKQIQKEFDDTQKFSHDGSLEATTLLLKRDAFSHEEEVRLISYNWEKNPKSKLFKYYCKPFELFDEIVLDPRLKTDEVSNLSEKLQNLGFDSEIIKHSKLYTLNESELNILSHPKNYPAA